MTTDREVLAELVALKDLKRRIDDHAAIGAGLAKHRVMVAEYLARKPLAWAAARARLALPEAGTWISVTERLPQVHGVLHPVMLAGEKPKLWMGFMAGGGWEPTPTECEEDDAREVTYWFELPPLLPTPSKDDLTEARGNDALGKALSSLIKEFQYIRTGHWMHWNREDQDRAGRAVMAAIDALAAPQINAPAPMSIKAKPLQWEKSGDDWHDKHLGFYITHDPGDDPELPYAAAWGEGDTQNFATLDEAKGWCQADIDRWVGEYAINAPALTTSYANLHKAAEEVLRLCQKLDSVAYPGWFDAIENLITAINAPAGTPALPSELSVLQSTVIPIEVQL